MILDTADPAPGAGLQIIAVTEHYGDRHLAWVVSGHRGLFFHSADRAVIVIRARIENDHDLVRLCRVSAMLGY